MCACEECANEPLVRQVKPFGMTFLCTGQCVHIVNVFFKGKRAQRMPLPYERLTLDMCMPHVHCSGVYHPTTRGGRETVYE